MHKSSPWICAAFALAFALIGRGPSEGTVAPTPSTSVAASAPAESGTAAPEPAHPSSADDRWFMLRLEQDLAHSPRRILDIEIVRWSPLTVSLKLTDGENEGKAKVTLLKTVNAEGLDREIEKTFAAPGVGDANALYKVTAYTERESRVLYSSNVDPHCVEAMKDQPELLGLIKVCLPRRTHKGMWMHDFTMDWSKSGAVKFDKEMLEKFQNITIDADIEETKDVDW